MSNSIKKTLFLFVQINKPSYTFFMHVRLFSAMMREEKFIYHFTYQKL